MTTLYWSMAMNAAQCLTIIVLIVVLVHYAREGAENRGRNDILERIIAENKTISITEALK